MMRQRGKKALDGMDDGDLIHHSLTGDREAFGALIDRYMESALSVARRISPSQQDAEDLVQEGFIRVLEKLDRFDPKRPFRPWLFRIITNLGLNRRRAEGIRATEPIPRGAPSHTPGPDRMVEQAETESRVREALAALPDRQRLVVTLMELEGLSSKEVGEILGLSDATVRWHLMEARKALRVALPAPDHAEEDGSRYA
ncbi:MAG: sigma-70 family RNA polymerase sigma factor [Gemmatimonadota bacterium]